MATPAAVAAAAYDKQEKYQYFDLALEIFRYFVFKEESQFIQ